MAGWDLKLKCEVRDSPTPWSSAFGLLMWIWCSLDFISSQILQGSRGEAHYGDLASEEQQKSLTRDIYGSLADEGHEVGSLRRRGQIWGVAFLLTSDPGSFSALVTSPASDHSVFSLHSWLFWVLTFSSQTASFLFPCLDPPIGLVFPSSQYTNICKFPVGSETYYLVWRNPFPSF